MAKSQPKILVYTATDVSSESYRYLESLGCQLVFLDNDLTVASLYQRLIDERGETVALLGNTIKSNKISEDFFKLFKDLRVISKYTIGTDDIDLDSANRYGIIVTNSPVEASWGGVAESVVAMMLSLLKKNISKHMSVLEGRWRDSKLAGRYLGARDDGFDGITLGIIGLGRVGSRLAHLLSTWNFTILACDPYVTEAHSTSLGVEKVSLQELLKRSDVVSLNCSLTSETHHILNNETLGIIKKGAVVINSARGQLIDELALCKSIKFGAVSQFAADVFSEEPLPMTSPLRQFSSDQVLFSPHMAAANFPGTLGAAIPIATDAVVDALKGVLPSNIVNDKASDLWQKRFKGKSLI